jgi:hypothetical protein
MTSGTIVVLPPLRSGWPAAIKLFPAMESVVSVAGMMER